MNIKELKKIIENLPDEMIVGSSGHFGEYLQCYDVYTTTVYKSDNISDGTLHILAISIESAGECPD